MIANTVDDQHRPLFPIEDGVRTILGRPVYACPSLPLYNASLGQQAAGSFCLFGDLSTFHVHRSTMLLRRLTQVPGLIDDGKCRYQSLLRVDSRLHDSSAGAVVSARLHA
jgi:HK97 family phage major capsid protein